MKKLAFVVSLVLAQALLAARPVAHWDVVPYQKVEGVFRLGVVAFHEDGVRVTFTVNGKKAYIAKRPSLNPRTGVSEFVFPFNAAKYKDGPVVIGATAETEGEEPYKLPDLPLFANAKRTQGSQRAVWVDGKKGNDYNEGTLEAPLQTLKRAVRLAGDGGTVFLLPGTYPMKHIGGGTDRKFWTVITTAPGVARESVRIAGGRSGTDKLKFVNLEMTCEAADGERKSVAAGEGGGTSVWFDNCSIFNLTGRNSGLTRPFSNGIVGYVTGGVTHDMTYGPRCGFVRGHEVRTIAGEAFSGGDCLVANVTVSDIDPSGVQTEDADLAVVDLYQGFAQPPHWVENVILYNVKAKDCKCRALTCRQVRHAAFVNVSFDGASGGGVESRFAEGLENALYARVDLGAQAWWWVKTSTGLENVKPKEVRLFDVKAASFKDGEELKGVSVAEECDIISFPKGEK